MRMTVTYFFCCCCLQSFTLATSSPPYEFRNWTYYSTLLTGSANLIDLTSESQPRSTQIQRFHRAHRAHNEIHSIVRNEWIHMNVAAHGMPTVYSIDTHSTHIWDNHTYFSDREIVVSRAMAAVNSITIYSGIPTIEMISRNYVSVSLMLRIAWLALEFFVLLFSRWHRHAVGKFWIDCYSQQFVVDESEQYCAGSDCSNWSKRKR